MEQVNTGVTKKKHPFVELLTVTFFMLGVPYVIFLMCRGLLKMHTNNSAALINAQAEAFAGIIGTGFTLILVMTDFFTVPLMAVIERWKELFADLRSGLWKEGMRSYLYSLKDRGISFWYYLALAGFEVFLIIDGTRRFLALIGW